MAERAIVTFGGPCSGHFGGVARTVDPVGSDGRVGSATGSAFSECWSFRIGANGATADSSGSDGCRHGRIGGENASELPRPQRSCWQLSPQVFIGGAAC